MKQIGFDNCEKKKCCKREDVSNQVYQKKLFNYII